LEKLPPPLIPFLERLEAHRPRFDDDLALWPPRQLLAGERHIGSLEVAIVLEVVAESGLVRTFI
jgi:hypothetical protein